MNDYGGAILADMMAKEIQHLKIEPQTTPDDSLTLGELVSFTVRALHPKQQRRIEVLECIREAKALGWIKDSCQDMDRIVTRAEAIQMMVKLCCEKSI